MLEHFSGYSYVDLVPGVEAVAMLRVQAATDPMETEVHEDEFELLYLQTGEKWLTVSGREYLMRGGDLMVIHPGDPHGNFDAIQNRTSMRYILIKSPDRVENFLGMSQELREELTQRLLALRLLRADDETRALLDKIMACADDAQPRDAFWPARFSALMALLLDSICSGKSGANPLSPDIREVVRFVEENPSEMFTVVQLAAKAGLSEARFKQKFKQQTGVPPAEYVARFHIRVAQEQLISTCDSVTEIAMRLGFSSSQHFSRLFQRYLGLSPSDFRRRNAQPPK